MCTICFPANADTEYAVIVHVYELGPKGGFGSMMKAAGMGVYHTGTEIRPLSVVTTKSKIQYSTKVGVEYAFGGSDRPGSGVWFQVPKQLPLGFAEDSGRYKKSVEMVCLLILPSTHTRTHAYPYTHVYIHVRLIWPVAFPSCYFIAHCKGTFKMKPRQFKQEINKLKGEWQGVCRCCVFFLC